MEQNKVPRTGPTTLWSIIYDKGGKNLQWEKTVSSINGVGKLDSYMQKNQTGPLS